MSRASRHRILAAMLSACLLSLLGGCTPLTVLAVLGGCKDGGSNGSSGGVTGSVTTGEVRDGMTIAQTKAWFNGSDGPDNNENMDAMRDMISARELRDRSIEEGWEIIDAMVDDGRLARKDEGEKAETSETYDPANPADPLSIADTSASAAATR